MFAALILFSLFVAYGAVHRVCYERAGAAGL